MYCMTFQSLQSQRTKGIYKSITKYILPDFNCIVRGVYSFKIIILIIKLFLCAIITILQLENTQGVKSLIIKKLCLLTALHKQSVLLF